MPSYTVSVQDTSPFLTYTGSWRAGHSSDDQFADRYSESSFTVTDSLSSSLSFTFYGIGAAIFGSKRPAGHGRYQVTLDGAPQPEGTSVSPANEFNATLYQSAPGSMANGWHTVVLTNRERRFLDVDTVSWIGNVGKDDEPLIVNTMQDTHPAFKYVPADAWSTSPFNVGQFAGASGHWTSTPGASVQVTFKGDAIALYGPVGPQAASSFSISLADRPTTNHSATKEFFRARQLLYYGADLGAGEHTLTMKFEGSPGGAAAGQALAVDYAEVYTAPSLGGSFDGATSSTQTTRLTIGLALCATLAFLSLSLLGVLCAMYKKGRITFTPSHPRSEIDPDSSYLDHSQEGVVVVGAGGGVYQHHTRNASDFSFGNGVSIRTGFTLTDQGQMTYAPSSYIPPPSSYVPPPLASGSTIRSKESSASRRMSTAGLNNSSSSSSFSHSHSHASVSAPSPSSSERDEEQGQGPRFPEAVAGSEKGRRSYAVANGEERRSQLPPPAYQVD